MNLSFLNDRFWVKVSESDEGCWEWLGAMTSRGYGNWGVSGVTHLVHRLTYQVFIADIPPSLVIDHLCRNQMCCNPWHLEAVPQRLNTLRGLSGHRSHCKHGHELTRDNLLVYARGRGGEHRMCRTCNRASKAKARLRNKQAVA